MRQHRPDPGVADQRLPGVPGRPADPGDQLGPPAERRGRDVGPQPRVVGGLGALGTVEGERVGEDQQCGTRHRGSGARGGGAAACPRCSPRAASGDGLRGGPARPNGSSPCRRSTATWRSGRPSRPHTSPAIMPPCATTTTMPSGLSAYSSSSSSITGRARRTTSMRDSPPGGAQPRSERHSAMAPGQSASISGDRAPLPLPEVGLPQAGVDLDVEAGSGRRPRRPCRPRGAGRS